MNDDSLSAWTSTTAASDPATPQRRSIVKIGGAAAAGLVVVTAVSAAALSGGANSEAQASQQAPVNDVPAAGAVDSRNDGSFGTPVDQLPVRDPAQAGSGDGQVLKDAPLPKPETKPVTLKQTQKLVAKYFPAKQAGNAIAVARAESGLTNAVGEPNEDGTIDWGLFQLNDGSTLQNALDGIGVKYKNTRQAQALALDPNINTKAAAWIWRDRGWAPWVAAYKIGVVKHLYSNENGPNYGRFDKDGVLKPKKAKPKPVAPAKPKPVKPAKPVKPGPTPTRKPTPTPTPTPTATATPTP